MAKTKTKIDLDKSKMDEAPMFSADFLNYAGVTIKDTEQTDPSSVQNSSAEPVKGTKEWSEFLVSQLKPHEITNGCPNNLGLRRLFETFIGPITESHVMVVQPPVANNGNRATVAVHLGCIEIKSGRNIRFSDAADCYEGNTNEPYSNYPVGTATTTAESRIFRKALYLTGLSAEEANSPSKETTRTVNEVLGVNSNQANDNQKKVITNLTDKIGLNLSLLLEDNKLTMDSLTYEQAQDLLRKLNKYERGEKNGGENAPEKLYK